MWRLLVDKLLCIVADFLRDVRDDERVHRHYHRALAALLMALLVDAAVVVVLMAGGAAPPPGCRPITAAAPMALELAAEPAALRALLGSHAASVPAEQVAQCTEFAIEQQRRRLGLDGALFIPLYVMLTAVVVAWMLAVSLHARDAGGQYRALPRTARWLAAAALAAVAVTAALDARENQAAARVLDLAMGLEAWQADALPGLHAALAASRSASLQKWLGAALWAASLAALAWVLASALAQPLWPRGRARLRRGLASALAAVGTIAAMALLGGAVLGLAGAETTTEPWTRGLLTLGFVANFIFALLVLALHLLRWRRRIVLMPTAEAPPPRYYMPGPPG